MQSMEDRKKLAQLGTSAESLPARAPMKLASALMFSAWVKEPAGAPLPKAAAPVQELAGTTKVIMNSSNRVWRALAAFLAVTAAARGQAAMPPATLSALPEAGFSVFRVLGALVLVLALFLGGVWVFKHWQHLFLQKGRLAKLNVLEVRSLGNRHALYVVGYEQQRMMLAASPSGVTLLSHLPSADAPEAALAEPDFSDTLQTVLGRKA
jgi:flagellar biogenesis protein FliO